MPTWFTVPSDELKNTRSPGSRTVGLIRSILSELNIAAAERGNCILQESLTMVNTKPLQSKLSGPLAPYAYGVPRNFKLYVMSFWRASDTFSAKSGVTEASNDMTAKTTASLV